MHLNSICFLFQIIGILGAIPEQQPNITYDDMTDTAWRFSKDKGKQKEDEMLNNNTIPKVERLVLRQARTSDVDALAVLARDAYHADAEASDYYAKYGPNAVGKVSEEDASVIARELLDADVAESVILVAEGVVSQNREMLAFCRLVKQPERVAKIDMFVVQHHNMDEVNRNIVGAALIEEVERHARYDWNACELHVEAIAPHMILISRKSKAVEYYASLGYASTGIREWFDAKKLRFVKLPGENLHLYSELMVKKFCVPESDKDINTTVILPNNRSVIIRTMRVADINESAELIQNALFKEVQHPPNATSEERKRVTKTKRPEPQKMMLRDLRKPERVTLVAEAVGANNHSRLMGSCQLSRVDSDVALLGKLAVKITDQRQRVGSAMLAQAEKYAREHWNVCEIQLNVRGMEIMDTEKNQPKLYMPHRVIAFFENQGYHTVGDLLMPTNQNDNDESQQFVCDPRHGQCDQRMAKQLCGVEKNT